MFVCSLRSRCSLWNVPVLILGFYTRDPSSKAGCAKNPHCHLPTYPQLYSVHYAESLRLGTVLLLSPYSILGAQSQLDKYTAGKLA